MCLLSINRVIRDTHLFLFDTHLLATLNQEEMRCLKVFGAFLGHFGRFLWVFLGQFCEKFSKINEICIPPSLLRKAASIIDFNSNEFSNHVFVSKQKFEEKIIPLERFHADCKYPVVELKHIFPLLRRVFRQIKYRDHDYYHPH